MNETNLKSNKAFSYLLQHNTIFYFAFFITIAILFGCIGILCSGTAPFNWQVLKLPFSMPNYIFPLIFLLMFLLTGTSFAFVWDKTRDDFSLMTWLPTLILLTILATWPFFFLLNGLKIVALCIAILCSALFIVLTYQHTKISLVSGILICITTLLCILLMVYNFWIVL